MRGIKCIFVEKKDGFNIEANSLLEDFKNNLRVKNLQAVRVVNKYILDEMNEENYKKSLYTIFAEKTVDNLYEESFPISPDEIVFAVEFLPGQYDQRADSASKCIGLVGAEENVEVKTAKVIVLKGKLTKEDIEKIKSYYINPVDSREVSLSNKELYSKLSEPKDVEILYDFVKKDKKEIEKFHKELGLAMSVDDLLMIRDYFKSEERIPTITEIKVIDTYWSDHCRHTTFSTSIEDIKFEKGKLNNAVQKSYESYLKSRDFVYEKNNKDKTLMDIAVIAMKEMRKRGMLDDLDISEEIYACSIKVNIERNNGIEEYLVMFKYETHYHPTEIEPFGGKEYAITAIPADFTDIDMKTMFIEMLDDFANISGKDAPNLIMEKVASMSCKAAVKGNNHLSRPEIEALIDELLELDNPYNCPHGRPTIISMTKYEIEKKFRRIV